MNDSVVHQAVDAVQAKDRRMRRGFVALALLVVVALTIGGFIQYLAIDAVKDQTQVLEDRSMIERDLLRELQQEGKERNDLIKLLRKRFRRADHRGVKGHNLIIDALDRILDLAGIELEPPLERVGQRRNGGGGADGSGDTGGSTPPPSPLPTVGNSDQCPPKNPHCQTGGKP